MDGIGNRTDRLERLGWCILRPAWFLLLLTGLVRIAHGQDGEAVRLVRMAEEADLGTPLSEEEVKAFLEVHSERLFRAPLDPTTQSETLRQLLGQKTIFGELARFEEATGISTKLDLVAWGDAFRFFSDYITAPSNPPLVAQMGDTWVPYFESLGSIAYAKRQTWDLRVLWYWRDMVDPEQIQTGRGFLEASRELDRKTESGLIAPFVIPTAVDWDLLHNLAIWLYNAGSEDLISTRPKWGLLPWKESRLAGRAGEAATGFLIELASNRYMDLPDKGAGEVAEDFLNRKYAMTILGTWMADRAEAVLGPEWSKQMGFTLPPRIASEQAFTFKGGSFLVVVDPGGARTPAVERAIRLAEHLSSPDSLRRYWPATSDLPADREVLLADPRLSSFSEALEHGRSYPSIPEWAPLVENLSTRDNLYAFWKRLSALGLSESISSAGKAAERQNLILAALRTAESDINRGLSPGQLATLLPWFMGSVLIAAAIGGVGFFRRLRERRITEGRIRESERRFRDLYDNAPDMFCSVDITSGLITQCNKMLEEKTGYERESVLGKNIYEMYHPDSHPKLRKAIRTFRKNGEVRDLEMQLLTKEGSTLDVSANVSAIRDSEGNITGTRTIWRDISQRKKTERDLQEQRETLAHFSRVATVGEMATSLAHELNQPLAAIVSNAQAGKRILGQGSDEAERILETLEDIASDGKRAGDIIHHVRNLLKKGNVERARLDVNRVVRSVERLLHSDQRLREVDVKLDLERDLPPISGVEIQLQQVLLNLVLNASEAMSDQTEPRIIILRTRSTGDKVEVSVEDRGSGIPAGKLESVFESFFTTKSKGLGLGLAISRSIIEDHCGKLTARPNPGRGTVVVFELPVDAQPGTPQEPAAPHEEPVA